MSVDCRCCSCPTLDDTWEKTACSHCCAAETASQLPTLQISSTCQCQQPPASQQHNTYSDRQMRMQCSNWPTRCPTPQSLRMSCLATAMVKMSKSKVTLISLFSSPSFKDNQLDNSHTPDSESRFAMCDPSHPQSWPNPKPSRVRQRAENSAKPQQDTRCHLAKLQQQCIALDTVDRILSH